TPYSTICPAALALGMHTTATRRSSDLGHQRSGIEATIAVGVGDQQPASARPALAAAAAQLPCPAVFVRLAGAGRRRIDPRIEQQDRKSTRLNSSHVKISYAVFCL